MPQVDPFKYLLEAVGRLTGGLITDLQSLFLGMILCSFLVMAIDLMKDVLLNPVVRGRAKEMYHDYRMNRLPEGPSAYGSPNASDRREIEISPLRQYDLDLAYNGVDSLEPGNSIYDEKQNAWERDGVELSRDRYQELESALDESIYNERMQHRMSGDEVESMFARVRR